MEDDRLGRGAGVVATDKPKHLQNNSTVWLSHFSIEQMVMGILTTLCQVEPGCFLSSLRIGWPRGCSRMVEVVDCGYVGGVRLFNGVHCSDAQKRRPIFDRK